MKVVVLGRGKVGRALARELGRKGVDVALRASGTRLPHPDGASAIYLLCVADPAIAALSARLAPALRARDTVLHCAGARGLDELAACAARGAATGVMHPLVSFASRRVAPPLAGATFVISGAPRARRAARALAGKLRAHTLLAPRSGPAYHAAAALLANGGAALAYAATRILVALGFARRDAERALSGLLASVAANVQKLGVPAALTGPQARGDLRTVAAHVRALRALSPDLASDYRRVQPLIARCAAALRALPASASKRARPGRATRSTGRARSAAQRQR